MICDIVTEKKFLAVKSKPVTSKKQIASVAKDLLDTVNSLGTACVGLAANQIGVNARIFAMRAGVTKQGTGGEWEIFVNPALIMRAGGISRMNEGCMSYPDAKPQAVRRFKIVKISFEDIDGIKHKQSFTGLEARIVQHELDHLNGILI